MKTSAPKTQAQNATTIFDLCKRITEALPDASGATWGDVGSSNDAKSYLVQALFALGGITVEEAKETFDITL
jgi:hypothetical protein